MFYLHTIFAHCIYLLNSYLLICLIMNIYYFLVDGTLHVYCFLYWEPTTLYFMLFCLRAFSQVIATFSQGTQMLPRIVGCIISHDQSSANMWQKSLSKDHSLLAFKGSILRMLFMQFLSGFPMGLTATDT